MAARESEVGVGRLVVALDQGVGVSAAGFAAAWDADAEARAAGAASVEAAGPGVYLPDAVTLVAIPLAVNLASSAVCALVGRLVAGLRGADRSEPGLEVVEVGDADGDRVVVVRMRGAQP